MKLQKKNALRMAACLLVMTVSVSAVSYAAEAETAPVAPTHGVAAVENDTSDPSSLISGLNDALEAAGDVDKDETVYVFAGADGTVKSTIVSDWLRNDGTEAELKDVSNLSDIENVEGDETFTQGDNGALTWEAQNNDIYYQGNTDAAAPVQIKVTYTLDGATVSPDDLAGKSGKVTIRFDYTNTSSDTEKVDGQDVKVNTPFVALTGLMLDNDHFSNVTVKNGKLMNDGDRTVVAGFALPGLQESLNLTDKDVDLPEYVEITADATDFKLETVYSVVSNFSLGSDSMQDADDAIADLGASLNKLTDAMNQLMDGSQKLADGTATLAAKAAALSAGVGKLTSGGQQVAAGAASLQSGLNQLTASNSTLVNGMYQTFQGLCASASTQLNAQLSSAGMGTVSLTPENYSQTIASLLEAVGGAAYKQAEAQVRTQVTETVKQQVTAGVNAQADQIYLAYVQQNKASEVYTGAAVQALTAQLTAAGKTAEEISAYLASETGKTQIAAIAAGLTDEQKSAALTAAAQGLTAEQKTAILAGAVDQQMNSESIKATIESNISAQMDTDAVKNAISAGLSNNASYQALISLKSQLDSVNQLYAGLQAYTNGVASAASGSGTLASGAAQLSSGLDELNSSMPALVSGTDELNTGATQLAAGIKELNSQGIEKIVNAYNGNLDGLTTRLKAIAKASEAYTNFSGLAEGQTGSVKFIYKFDSIGD